MQLNLGEVQIAVADYLRKHGVIVEDVAQVQLELIGRSGERINIVGAAPTVIVHNVELPDGPYR